MLQTILSDFLTTKVISVGSGALYSKALALLKERDVSCILVEEDNMPIGILTERDVVRLAKKYNNGEPIDQLLMSEVMTSPVRKIGKHSNILETYEFIKQNNLRHIVAVNDDGTTAGIATQTDVINALGLTIYEKRPVSKIMSIDLHVADPDTPLQQIIAQMVDKNVSCVVIEEDGSPVGVISERKITGLSRRGLEFMKGAAADHMTTSLIIVDESTPVYEGARLMKQKHFRRLLVTRENKGTVGIVTQSDIVSGLLETRYAEYVKQELKKKDLMLQSMEETLEKQTVFLESIIESTQYIGIVVFDQKGHIIYNNQTAANLASIADFDGDKTNAEEVFYNCNISVDFHQLVAKSHLGKTFGEVVKIETGWTERWVEYTFSCMQGRGNNVGYLLFLNDITDQRLIENKLRSAIERAEKATKLKDKFLSLVAHDLRSPLAKQITIYNFLAENCPGKLTEKEVRMLSIAGESSKRMVEMIDKLLDIGRLRHGEIKLRKSYIPASSFIENQLQLLREWAKEKGVSTFNEITTESYVYADPTLIGEVVQNIVSNAIKFCGHGDTITIHSPGDRNNVIAISDTGEGIDQSMLPDLFKHEIKTTKTGTAGERGTGLGLPYCKDIVNAHAGEITATSVEGEGSTFIIHLPINSRSNISSIKPLGQEIRSD